MNHNQEGWGDMDTRKLRIAHAEKLAGAACEAIRALAGIEAARLLDLFRAGKGWANGTVDTAYGEVSITTAPGVAEALARVVGREPNLPDMKITVDEIGATRAKVTLRFLTDIHPD